MDTILKDWYTCTRPFARYQCLSCLTLGKKQIVASDDNTGMRPLINHLRLHHRTDLDMALYLERERAEIALARAAGA